MKKIARCNLLFGLLYLEGAWGLFASNSLKAEPCTKERQSVNNAQTWGFDALLS